ncbi:MAG: hypothetical protein AB3N13_02415 [Arenibacterium sp.]
MLGKPGGRNAKLLHHSTNRHVQARAGLSAKNTNTVKTPGGKGKVALHVVIRDTLDKSFSRGSNKGQISSFSSGSGGFQRPDVEGSTLER